MSPEEREEKNERARQSYHRNKMLESGVRKDGSKGKGSGGRCRGAVVDSAVENDYEDDEDERLRFFHLMRGGDESEGEDEGWM